MVYQPMLELLDYLRAHVFQTWIVSGGGVEFMRLWAKRVSGVPPQQVIGSSIGVQFQMRAAEPVCFACRKVISSTTGKASRSVFTNSSDDTR